jgi:hypothetical protein
MKIPFAILLVLVTLCLAEPVIIFLKEQVDLDTFAKTHSHLHVDKRAQILVDELQSLAKSSQRQLISYFKTHNIRYRSYWSPNFISTSIDPTTLPLSLTEQIQSIIPNSKVHVDLEESDPSTQLSTSQNTVDWNIKWIKADLLWAKNITGHGIIVSNSDTGIKWNHPALVRTYLGSTQSPVNHNYAWWDALHDHIDDPENVCGYNLTAPCDGNKTLYLISRLRTWISCDRNFHWKITSKSYIWCSPRCKMDGM